MWSAGQIYLAAHTLTVPLPAEVFSLNKNTFTRQPSNVGKVTSGLNCNRHDFHADHSCLISVTVENYQLYHLFFSPSIPYHILSQDSDPLGKIRTKIMVCDGKNFGQQPTCFCELL